MTFKSTKVELMDDYKFNHTNPVFRIGFVILLMLPNIFVFQFNCLLANSEGMFANDDEIPRYRSRIGMSRPTMAYTPPRKTAIKYKKTKFNSYDERINLYRFHRLGLEHYQKTSPHSTEIKKQAVALIDEVLKIEANISMQPFRCNHPSRTFILN